MHCSCHTQLLLSSVEFYITDGSVDQELLGSMLQAMACLTEAIQHDPVLSSELYGFLADSVAVPAGARLEGIKTVLIP